MINGTIVLSDKQKRVNRILVFVIPFIWGLFVRAALKVTPGSHEAPAEIAPSNISAADFSA